MPLHNAQTRGSFAPLAQETEQFSSKESVVGANPTRGAYLEPISINNNNSKVPL